MEESAAEMTFDYLGQCGVRNFWSAEFLRNVNRPKAALRKRVEFLNWPDTFLIAFG